MRHPLPAILALACCALRCGARRDRASAEGGRHDGAHLARALGFRPLPPWAATLHLMFRRVGGVGFEAPLGAWAAGLVASMAPGTGRPQAAEPAVALAGTTLRGSRKPGAPRVHRLSALAHPVGVTRAQQAVAEKTNVMTAVETVLSQLVLTGRVVTRDALLTPTAVAQRLVAAGGDEGMLVNANHPQLRADIERILAEPPVGDPQETAPPIAIGHGRIEQRRLTTRQARVGYRAWPGLAQVFEVERSVIMPNTGAVRSETVDGVTSLVSQRATPSRVLALVRGPWQLENQSPGVREGTFDEDRSQVRCGNIPQVMAALRKTAIGLLRRAGYANMAAACRLLAAQPRRALARIGIQRENSMTLGIPPAHVLDVLLLYQHNVDILSWIYQRMRSRKHSRVT